MEIAAIGAAFAAVILWDLAMVDALRFVGITLPFSFALHFLGRREREVLAALNGRSSDSHVLVAGYLLFACPLFAGITAYDYIVRHFIKHSTIGLDSIVGSLAILVITGYCVGVNNWKKRDKVMLA
jgi:hypothetical protein